MKRYLFIFFMVLLIGCNDNDEPELNEIENLIVSEITVGSLVMVYYDDEYIDVRIDDGQSTTMVSFEFNTMPLIDGISIFARKRCLTTGCFSIPTCVRMDELKKATIRISEDDFAVYNEIDNTGILYFLDTYYAPYWYSNELWQIFRNEVDNYGGGIYKAKRQNCCLLDTGVCDCEPDTTTEIATETETEDTDTDTGEDTGTGT